MDDNFQTLLIKVNQKLNNSNLYYLSNDPERALGLENQLQNFHVVYIDKANYDQIFVNKNLKHFCLHNTSDDEIFRSSVKLIKSKEFADYFNSTKKDINYFQTFKVSSAFTHSVEGFGGISLNTTSKLNHLFEDKLSQFEQIGKLPISLPHTKIAKLSEVKYLDLKQEFGEAFVIQFNRGHTGSGTVFIQQEADLIELQTQFPEMQVKFSEFVTGQAYTLNCCVGSNGIYLGGLSYQITGIPELTPNAGGTVGNDWQYRRDFISGHERLANDVIEIGKCMRQSGYKGLFGIDLIVQKDGSHKIIEINARQPASIPMYTKMQIQQGQIPLSLIHLAEFLGIEYNLDQATYNQENLKPLPYSQIFIRPLEDMQIHDDVKMGLYNLKGDLVSNNQIISGVISGEGNENVIFLDEDKDKSLIYVKEAYSIDEITLSESFIVLPQMKGRLIKKNAELARIQLKDSALDANGNLMHWVKEVLLSIKEKQI